ncbi:pseudaminic acid cytidylyltransferase [Polynucleobacter sp. AP-Sanab-80-C2]|uniref:pseudaminic acid cytidylyltransferase n=1 Tax=Polynucleobacter sp. AP-Sanab-80-C2 TaxID=3108274 RepID=UPI002B23C188|nr:pseudaminic acid cytidylyltransferase [Polynucleobacter sp. AP-Sanab-80-C2]MEA9598558.1 pseudaminic acid cytidylyltransferase [Polynucleobacter sp. AP-Sanab-80-C2]
MKIAIIPARSGSKRIPQKNIRDFSGKPIIAWSIAAALNSKCFDRIIVTTDSPMIAEIARSYGAETPFLRPANLSDDHTPTIPVIQHAIKEASYKYGEFSLACCIYPTAPLISSEDIAEGLNALLNSDSAEFSFGAARFSYPVQRGFTFDGNNGVRLIYPEHRNTRSQDLPPVFHDAGQFCWGFSSAFLAGKDIFTATSIPIILPTLKVKDIDTIEDWEAAEFAFNLINKST